MAANRRPAHVNHFAVAAGAPRLVCANPYIHSKDVAVPLTARQINLLLRIHPV